jgi:hypothetical protein
LLVTITVALAAVAVLASIVVVAVGGGGELSTEHPDHPPLALPGRRAVGGTDAALLRLPLGLWGYHKQITDEALERFAYELTERDTRIAVLEQELAEARQGTDSDSWDRRRALPAGRGDMPVMGEEPFATGTGQDSGSFAPPDGREDPFVTRSDGIPMSNVPAEAPYAPPTDPWKTILDRPADEAGEEKTEATEAETDTETAPKAEHEADDVEETRTARKDGAE